MDQRFLPVITRTGPSGFGEERVGIVFELNGAQTNCPISPKRVCRIVSCIGKKAGVVVAFVEKRKRIDGKPIATEGKKVCFLP
jgi:hypothetical protein